MLIVRYLRWTGSHDEFRDYANNLRDVCDEFGDVSLRGLYEPYNEWHYVMLFEATNNERFLEAIHENSVRNGRSPHISLIKVDLLFPFS